MIHFDLPKQQSSIIKVLGVGGGGSNAVNYMFDQNIEGVDFIICNTDAKALQQSSIPNKIQLGPHLTQGLGAGANPEIGKQATVESLEEIKRILEVNTKMAFICAGMGGGTGTGGAPIIARLCQEAGILTVGIVTTPFSFEGPRRLQQAEKGIKELEPYVDTLLVISNDKLRIQFGNLKMRDAFAKADNVLATAAKCITDIINSRGHIIVDFADVCTVMKNGGVAILGSAAVEGENRAQQAIEEALNSPLLNDNDIRGAKWILININSAEGEHECTMDELEIINGYLRQQAGENADVIVGMGYDNNLDKKIGITLIATGFEHKDPFIKQQPASNPQPKEEKIVMTLGIEGEEKKLYNQQSLPFEDKDPYAPTLSESVEEVPSHLEIKNKTNEENIKEEKENFPLRFELNPEITSSSTPLNTTEQTPEEPKMEYKEKPVTPPAHNSSEFLKRPAQIYASENTNVNSNKPSETQKPAEEQQPSPTEANDELQFQLVMKEDKNNTASTNETVNGTYIENEQKRNAERIQRLRNLSFNINATDASNELDVVPAYVRKNMELYGHGSLAENFYSKYTVKKDEKDETSISSLNTFLEGKKPD